MPSTQAHSIEIVEVDGDGDGDVAVAQQQRRVLTPEDHERGDARLERVVAMLTRLCK